MLRLVYLWRNLTRNKLRTALTCAAVGLPMIIFVLSTAVIGQFRVFLDNAAKQLRLAVTNRVSIMNPLPVGHAAKIRSLDPDKKRLTAICGMSWIGGQVPDSPVPLSTMAADSDTFFDCFPEMGFTAEEKEAWFHDRQAIIVGEYTAKQNNWKVGDRITITQSVPPFADMEFHVISTAPEAKDKITNWFHRAYLEETLKANGLPEGKVTFYFIKCASKADSDYYRTAIDEKFANSPDETKTQDEKAFMNEFITQQFNLPRNLTILASLTVFVAVMAATNTMSMNFRDRISEFATLKSMGFRSGFVFSQIECESLLVCGIGGALGAFIPYSLMKWSPLAQVAIPVIQTLPIPIATCLQAIGVALAIGLVAGLWPGWQAARMRVIKALRTLE